MLRRPDADRVGHLRATQRCSRKVSGSAVDGLAVHESVAIGNGHRVHVTRIHVIEVANVRVIKDIHVTNVSVVDVDVSDVSAAAVVPREKRFAEAQREPADSESKPAAEETDKGRSVNRRAIIRTRAPAPPASEIIPAAVVVGRETPG